MNKEATVQISPPKKKILSKAQPPPENKAHLLNQFYLLFPCYVLMNIKNLKLRVPSTSATLAAQSAPQSSLEKQQKPAAKEDLSLSHKPPFSTYYNKRGPFASSLQCALTCLSSSPSICHNNTYELHIA